MTFKKLLPTLGLLGASLTTFGQASSNCQQPLSPICGDAGLQFTASSGVTPASSTNPGNNYDCLFTSPNPTWYYMQVSQSGTIDFSLSAPQDIDFIIYGPFADLAAAQAGCGSYGTGGAGANVVDCSYSATNNETPSISGATVGEIYVMLITNYANSVQDVVFQQTGGTGSTDCNIVTVPPCVSDPGTFVYQKDPAGPAPLQLTTSPIYLCQGDAFQLVSNGDYTLPNDTIAQPVGDGIYSAQLMWLVYNAPPVANTAPNLDPGFLSMIIPSEDLMDINNSSSPVVQALSCGTYYFVPVAGDDGVGGNNNSSNGINDNGSLNWDKNLNGCYLLGPAVEVTYACPMQTNSVVNCNPPPGIVNGMNINITGGSGNYTVVNLGAGNLVSTNVTNGGTATVANLNNNSNWNIQITDAEGCKTTATGTFAAPVISNISLTPAPDCPGSGTGSVSVNVTNGSGQGGPYSIVMAGDPPTVGTTDSYTDVAGTGVPIVVADQAGCISDTSATIPSALHSIMLNVVSTNEFCYGDGTGSATVTATPVPSGSSTITTIVWEKLPSGPTFPGTATNTVLNNMSQGNWVVTVTDNIGCVAEHYFTIGGPQELDIYVENVGEPNCYGLSDGSIDVGVSGGTQPIAFSWSHSAITTDVANIIPAGNYWAYVTDANGCMDSVNIVLDGPDSLYADYIVKNVDCYGQSTGGIIITDVHGNTGIVEYDWDLGGVIPDPPVTSNLSGNLPAGTYSLILQDEKGCTKQYHFNITQNSPIVMAPNGFGSFPAYCRISESQNGNGVLYAAATGGVPGYVFSWLNLGTGDTHFNSTWGSLNPGNYQVTVTDQMGCTLVETITVDSVSPIADFTVLSAQLNGNLEGTSPVEVQFVNQSQYFANIYNPNADTTFYWNLDTSNNSSWYYSDYFDEVIDTVYTGEEIYHACLIAENKNGCKDTACMDIIVHDIPDFTPPNIFTPGGDGTTNDVFTFELKSKAVKEFSAAIFDRWGKKVFEFTSIQDAWNGDNKNGTPCTDGVYFYNYEVVYTNGTTGEGQGTITLIRE